MEAVDYFAIIHKYIPPQSLTYRIYLPHVILVTAKALRAGCKLGLSAAQLRFIEEAAMLHDIGIVAVDAPQLGCNGPLPYLCHGVEGARILRAENLAQHALVAERHIGVGLTRQEIIARQLPLPARDMLPLTVEEELISWADLFFSKDEGKLWLEKRVAKIEKSQAKRGLEKVKIFNSWQERFADGLMR